MRLSVHLAEPGDRIVEVLALGPDGRLVAWAVPTAGGWRCAFGLGVYATAEAAAAFLADAPWVGRVYRLTQPSGLLEASR